MTSFIPSSSFPIHREYNPDFQPWPIWGPTRLALLFSLGSLLPLPSTCSPPGTLAIRSLFPDQAKTVSTSGPLHLPLFLSRILIIKSQLLRDTFHHHLKILVAYFYFDSLPYLPCSLFLIALNTIHQEFFIYLFHYLFPPYTKM